MVQLYTSQVSQSNALVLIEFSLLCHLSRGYPIKSWHWDSFHWYSWVKCFFRLVVTVTASWQALTIQRPLSSQWILEFIYSNLFWGELESIESFKWIRFLQQWKKRHFCNSARKSNEKTQTGRSWVFSLWTQTLKYFQNDASFSILIGNRCVRSCKVLLWLCSIFITFFSLFAQLKGTNNIDCEKLSWTFVVLQIQI